MSLSIRNKWMNQQSKKSLRIAAIQENNSRKDLKIGKKREERKSENQMVEECEKMISAEF